MTLGIALLLIFILYMVTINHTWRQIATWLVGLSLVGFGCFVGYGQYEEYQTTAKANAVMSACVQRGGWMLTGDAAHGYADYCYVPPTPAEVARAAQAEQDEAARQAAASAALRADEIAHHAAKVASELQAKKAAEAEAQRVLAAHLDSVSWKPIFKIENVCKNVAANHQAASGYIFTGTTKICEDQEGALQWNELVCKAHPAIKLGSYFAPQTSGGPYWAVEVFTDMTTSVGAERLQDHTTEDLAKQDILRHAHYDLCTQ